jgi:hypothetical protein
MVKIMKGGKNMAKLFGILVITISLTLAVFATEAFATETSEAHEIPLTVGWDITNEPLGIGTVTWSYDQAQSDLGVKFSLVRAIPDHKYIVGVHLFNPRDLTKRPSEVNPAVNNFFGTNLGGGCISREETSACVDDFDFGTLTTDGNGNGEASFSGYVPPHQTYYAQFTVRIGDKCPGSGCPAVYRTGDKFAQNFEEIKT